MQPRLSPCCRVTRSWSGSTAIWGASRIVGEDSHVTLQQRAPAKWPWVWGLGPASGSIVGLQLILRTWPWFDWTWDIFCRARLGDREEPLSALGAAATRSWA